MVCIPHCTKRNHLMIWWQAMKVININNNHWVLISTFGCSQNTVKLYDSLNGSIGFQTIDVIASLFWFETPTFSIKLMNVVWQWSVCPLCHSIMMSIAHGEEPDILRYDQEEMRDHLTSCFNNKEMTLFPSKRRKVKSYEHKTELWHKLWLQLTSHRRDDLLWQMQWMVSSCVDSVIENIDDNRSTCCMVDIR